PFAREPDERRPAETRSLVGRHRGGLSKRDPRRDLRRPRREAVGRLEAGDARRIEKVFGGGGAPLVELGADGREVTFLSDGTGELPDRGGQIPFPVPRSNP